MLSIIISGMPAVGKSSVARAVAERFGLKLITGGDMLKQMAEEKGYKVGGDDWWDTPEGMAFLQERHSTARFDHEVDARLEKAVEEGGVVVTSYPLPWLSKSGVKIWLTASHQKRARRMAKRDGTPFDEAVKAVAKRDSENRRLYRKLYGIKFGEDLSIFDLAVNTDRLQEGDVAEVVCAFIKPLTEKSSVPV